MKKKVTVEAKGGFRRIGVVVEAQPIQLSTSGQKLKGAKLVEFDRSEIDVRVLVRGGMNAKYDVSIKINGESKPISGNVTGGVKLVSRKWKRADFGF